MLYCSVIGYDVMNGHMLRKDDSEWINKRMDFAVNKVLGSEAGQREHGRMYSSRGYEKFLDKYIKCIGPH